jgi:hypothetical protein
MAHETSDEESRADSPAQHYIIPHDIILIRRLWPVTKKAFSIQLLLHRMSSMRPDDYRRAQKTIVCLDRGIPFK